jgi:hypothetical protein
MLPADLLKQYIILHNSGVELSNFEPLMSLFAPEAVLDFVEPPLGKFEGIMMIRGIFRSNPPDFLLGIGKISKTPEGISSDYSDLAHPDIRLGTIELVADNHKIISLLIGK